MSIKESLIEKHESPAPTLHWVYDLLSRRNHVVAPKPANNAGEGEMVRSSAYSFTINKPELKNNLAPKSGRLLSSRANVVMSRKLSRPGDDPEYLDPEMTESSLFYESLLKVMWRFAEESPAPSYADTSLVLRLVGIVMNLVGTLDRRGKASHDERRNTDHTRVRVVLEAVLFSLAQSETERNICEDTPVGPWQPMRSPM